MKYMIIKDGKEAVGYFNTKEEALKYLFSSSEKLQIVEIEELSLNKEQEDMYVTKLYYLMYNVVEGEFVKVCEYEDTKASKEEPKKVLFSYIPHINWFCFTIKSEDTEKARYEANLYAKDLIDSINYYDSIYGNMYESMSIACENMSKRF